MSGSLNWGMTLKAYQSYLAENKAYQSYCREKFDGLKSKDDLNKPVMYFTMAVLLGGVSSSGQGRDVFCDEIAHLKNRNTSTWYVQAGTFLSGKEAFGDANSDIQAFHNNGDKTIQEAYDWLCQSRLEGLDRDKLEKVHSMIDMLLPSNVPVLVQSGEEDRENDMTAQIIDLIEQGGCRQIILTGAPGTGKTYTATQIAQKLGKRLEGEERPYWLVQFHPSMDYTDFVEGLRPVMKGDNMVFVRMDGTFKRFCRKVAAANEAAGAEEGALYFFIVDEINRANLSKVFGELMYCMERDKRGKGHRVKTQYENLPTYQVEEDCFKEGFFIPENVVILGTMNDIDRSVDSMDFALRRRFEWKEFVVEEGMLCTAFQQGNYNRAIRENAGLLARSICRLNREYIQRRGREFGLNRQYDISQGQFANIPLEASDLEQVKKYAWDYRIESLLREYLRGEDEERVTAFLNDAKAAFMDDPQKADEEPPYDRQQVALA